MPSRVVACVALTLLLFTMLPCDADEDDTGALYRRGVQLISPYLILTDAPAADPTTAKGKSDLLEGIDLLAKVVKADPDNWAARWVIGKAQQALRNHRAAYESFREAYVRKSDHPDVGRELVIEAICIGETKEAVATAQQLARAHPDNAGLAANAGLALLADGNLTEAKATTELALKMAPQDPVTKALLGEIVAVQAGRRPASYCPP
jgi:tetratricopeptide (TPR) repeat protein